jgi:hypothetical protein
MAQQGLQLMDTLIPNGLSQATTETPIPLPAQIVAANICTENPEAQFLFAQMAHPASMIMQASQHALDTLPTTVASTATTLMKSTAEIE